MTTETKKRKRSLPRGSYVWWVEQIEAGMTEAQMSAEMEKINHDRDARSKAAGKARGRTLRIRWEGLSDLERAQHRCRSARGAFESFTRRLDRAGQFGESVERDRSELEALELKLGLRKKNS
jgi:hypothetical protein